MGEIQPLTSAIPGGRSKSETLRFRQMEAESFEYIEVSYNRKRQHSTLKYKPPAQYIDDWISTQERKNG